MPGQRETGDETGVGHQVVEAYTHPRLAAVYDAKEGDDREDLAVYATIIGEFSARSVLDVGCGTGTLATSLACAGIDVVGVDPSGPYLDIARGKVHAERVTWVHGTAPDVLPLQVDMAVMTANAAQEILSDSEWLQSLEAICSALRPGGRFVFESRDPARRPWEQWTKQHTHRVVDVPGDDQVESWVQVTSVQGELVSFGSPTIFRRDGVRIDSTSTLRFRSREALSDSLESTGFAVEEVRDAPDRPGREFVFIARKV